MSVYDLIDIDTIEFRRNCIKIHNALNHLSLKERIKILEACLDWDYQQLICLEQEEI